MTLFHIDDLTAFIPPSPLPWNVIGVLPTVDDHEHLGDIAFRPENAFCYTVSDGPTEVWCPMESVEGRHAPAATIAWVLNHIYPAVTAHQLWDGDNVIVPLGFIDPDTGAETLADAVFWIGTAVDDPDHVFQCYQSPNTRILPVRWSSPLGWPE